MRLFYGVLAALVLCDVDAKPVDKDAKHAGAVMVPLDKRKVMGSELRGLRVRSPAVTQMDNLVDFYSIDVELGTPPQKVSLLVDTGSGDTWVYSSGTGNIYPKFDPAKSETWHANRSKFSAVYYGGAAEGVYGTDTLRVNGNLSVSGQSLAVVSAWSVGTVPGMLGLGLPSTQVSALKYMTLPQTMVARGLIATPTFSLVLDDVGSRTGTLIFGGVDHSRYTGKLYVVPRIDETFFDVKLDGIEVGGQALPGLPLSVTLDSGTSLGWLPRKLLDRIAAQARLSFDAKYRYYYTTGAIPAVNVTWDFSGARFDMPLARLFIEGGAVGPPFAAGRKVLGFQRSEDATGMAVLGDVFLRQFYVVFDHARPQIALAQASTPGARGSPDVEAITSGHIPRSVPAPAYTGLKRVRAYFGRAEIVFERVVNKFHEGVLSFAQMLSHGFRHVSTAATWLLAKRDELIRSSRR